jgi:RimJ/RimL family protein N-acetyltransferase
VSAPSILRGPRVTLRRWQESDREPFAQLNADPLVMEWFPGVIDRDSSDAFADRIEAGFEVEGFGLWAVEVEGAPFIGYVGLSRPSFDAAFTPAVEVGWRLAAAYWGKGYATEAAGVAVADGFERVELAEIVSFTVAGNQRSIAVMERLGMTRDLDGDFDHPALEATSPLARHVLYRLSRTAWRRNR